ncbi:hypothetical protein O6H91_06G027400 [Diphasiastrum complanatum]|uniref:Uncharacterized protein n=1 Tax=Diphasiastrum complanatum TaxID=34168 RepID=A0ACC2DBU6_DIPCM|nr:hypothetical protein O6H91_06G027400 [Diphasiastrum complanatum]
MVGKTCQSASALLLLQISSAPSQLHEKSKVERHCVTWTPKEDQLLQEHVRLHGTEKWGIIATKLHPKTGRQCRRRWQMYLNSASKKGGGWSAEEDQFLLEAHQKYGNRWTEIAKAMFGRTDNAVKNRFMSLRKKRAKELHLSATLSKGYRSDGTKQLRKKKASEQKIGLEIQSLTSRHSRNEASPQAQADLFLHEKSHSKEWSGFKPKEFLKIVREAARNRDLISPTTAQPALFARDASSMASEASVEQVDYIPEDTLILKGTNGSTLTTIGNERMKKNTFPVLHAQLQDEESTDTYCGDSLRRQAEVDASYWFEEAEIESREHRTMPCILHSTVAFCGTEEELINDLNIEFMIAEDIKQECQFYRTTDGIPIDANLIPETPKQDHASKWMDTISFSESIITPVHVAQVTMDGNTSPQFSEGEKQFLLSTFDDYCSGTEVPVSYQTPSPLCRQLSWISPI